LIFGGDKADNKLVNGLMNAFESQDVNEFLQLFSTASLEYYLSIKEDEGVINDGLNYIINPDVDDTQQHASVHNNLYCKLA
jgi:hypothetical protein